jgi:hypothetical protein
MVINHKTEFTFDPSLAFYAPLWKKDGNTIESDDACGRLLTVNGALWQPDGRSFDSVDDEILLPDNILDLTGAYTLEFWGNPAGGDSSYRRWFCLLDTIHGKAIEIVIRQSDGCIGVRADGASILSATGVPGSYQHVVVARSLAGGLSIFRDAVQLAITASGPTTDPTYSALGGGLSGGYLAAGRIGEARAYSRELLLPELQRNYLATKWRYQ